MVLSMKLNARKCIGFIFFPLLMMSTECFMKSQRISKNRVADGTSSPPVRLQKYADHVVVDNGIFSVTFSSPQGMVIGLQYNGIANILEDRNQGASGGYWDVTWSDAANPKGIYSQLVGTQFNVITENENQVEISFTTTWDAVVNKNGISLNVDKRFIVQRGYSGFYAYGILERLAGWPDADIGEVRIAFKLKETLFRYMALSDQKQRIMPSAEDRIKGVVLDYAEAVLLTNPSDPSLKGEVDDKYQYSTENKDNKLHGWICLEPRVGFWMITPSAEFTSAGPVKQELTSHVGPTTLSVFFSTHYAGQNLDIQFRNGEPWKKVFGPVSVYLNSGTTDKDPRTLWDDAKQRMLMETGKWPYDFVQSLDYPPANGRGTISGRLQISDGFISKDLIAANFAYIGLAAPGEAGSWQYENKGYQFWTQTDALGHFSIKGVRPGNYSLYAWAPGFIGDYKYESIVSISPGNQIEIGDLVYKPPRNGPTLWEIGIPDRIALEFNIPDPSPNLVNHLYVNYNSEKYRQYGLWDKYTELYPTNDLVYTVGLSTYQKDWFFAHVTRNVGNKNYIGTTWKILFDIHCINKAGMYTLQVALASASYAELQVRINLPDTKPLFATGLIGKDNSIARHGIHGLYWLYSIGIPGSLFQDGQNTIFLTQPRGGSPFSGFMYDYIRLELPPQ